MWKFEFLFITVAWCIAVAIAVPLGNENKSQEIVRVVVIGAGVAGLKAASDLHNAGFNVTLLEAMDRIGGRTHTFKMDNGQYTELGAEWIHGQVNNSIYELASPLGLLHDDETLEFGEHFGLQTGEFLNQTMQEQITKVLEYVWDDPDKWGDELGKDLSMGDFARFILEKFNNTYPIHSDPVILEAVYDWMHRATNAEDSTENNWFEKSNTDKGEQYIDLEGHQNVRWKPPYSYASLHQLILTGNVTEDGIYELPEWIKLNTEVTSISYSTSRNTVTVTTLNGTEYVADHVVFTGSLGVLKANHLSLFSPPLSQFKQLAIQHIGFGYVTKLAFEFEEPWWPLDFEGIFPLWTDHDYKNASLQYWRSDITDSELLTEYDGIALWCRSILNFFNVDSGSAPNVFRAWVAGKPSRLLDTLEPKYIQDQVMRMMRLFFSSQYPNITDPVRMYRSSWPSNPHVRGAYSFRSLESEEFDVWARDLQQPIIHLASSKPIVCFAGEATNPKHFATVHGAYDTGIREYERILNFYAVKL